jgi:hypothetical protein
MFRLLYASLRLLVSPMAPVRLVLAIGAARNRLLTRTRFSSLARRPERRPPRLPPSPPQQAQFCSGFPAAGDYGILRRNSPYYGEFSHVFASVQLCLQAGRYWRKILVLQGFQTFRRVVFGLMAFKRSGVQIPYPPL